jgi:linoleoyl-CoA desaturase
LHGMIFFVTMHIGLGFTLAIVFQLAHVVERIGFEFVSPEQTKRIEHEWAIHQLQTTSDFSPSSPLLSWLLGGLNYQVEHHLFPRISHIHYPAISNIVKLKCVEFNLPYHCIPTIGKAVNSHFRLLKQLGKKPAFINQSLA